MAWTLDGGAIFAGESVTWSFGHPGLTYAGIQVVQAQPLPTPILGGGSLVTPALLVVSNAGLQLIATGSPQGGYAYQITVTNTGPSWTTYQLVGTSV